MRKKKTIKLYEKDEDILEDVIIENKQAMDMSKVYSDILNGVMKFLISITIILAISTIILIYIKVIFINGFLYKK